MGIPGDLDPTAEAAGRRLLTAAFEATPGDSGLVPGELLRRVRRQRARRRRVRALAPTGAVVALAAALALGLTLTASVAQAPSARAAVTAAAAKTSAQSFRFTSTTTQTTVPAAGYNGTVGSVAGVFDPVSKAGEVTSRELPETRVVGGHVYVNLTASPLRLARQHVAKGRLWLEGRLQPPPPPGALPVGPLAGSDDPVDPTAMLGWLQSAGSVRAQGPVSGPGWTGTRYAFTERTPAGAAPSTKVSGTVYVDSRGRVRQLVTTLRYSFRTSGSQQATGRVTTGVTFADFGIPVAVAAPPGRPGLQPRPAIPDHQRLRELRRRGARSVVSRQPRPPAC